METRALAGGGAGAFFPLCGAFETQAEPAFCGLGALTSVLNALGVDPGRPWLSPASGRATVWRWFGDTMLDCCKPLDEIRAVGLTLDEVACLARCNGAAVRLERGRPLEAFREAVRAACAEGAGSDPADREFMVASYDRGALNQTGSGHFAPVAAFAPAGRRAPEDMVLLFDVAKFKYPPHWVPLAALHAAMQAADPATGQPRGYLLLRRRGQGREAPQLSLDLPQAAAALAYARGVRAWLEGRAERGAPRRGGGLVDDASLAEDFVSFANGFDPPGFRASECLRVHAPATGSSVLQALRDETLLLKAWAAGRPPAPGRSSGEAGPPPLDSPGPCEGGRGAEPSRCSCSFLSDREARAVLALASPACDDSWSGGAEQGRGRWDPTPVLAAGPWRPDEPAPAPWRPGGLGWWARGSLPRAVAREVDHVAAQLRAFAAGS